LLALESSFDGLTKLLNCGELLIEEGGRRGHCLENSMQKRFENKGRERPEISDAQENTRPRSKCRYKCGKKYVQYTCNVGCGKIHAA
jgi:hypothetical protein